MKKRPLKKPASRSRSPRPHHRFRFRWCLVADRWLLGCFLLAFACGCRRDMFSQPKSNPLQPSAFFADGAASRPLPAHVVAQGDRQNDELFYTGMIGTNLATVLPFPLTPEMLARGRQRFEITCVPCHGEAGEANGMVVQRGFPAPPSYHIDRLREAPIGHFFDVMTRGYGVMFSQAERVTPEDRWAIAAYIRALQFSQHAQVADLSGGELARLTNAP